MFYRIMMLVLMFGNHIDVLEHTLLIISNLLMRKDDDVHIYWALDINTTIYKT